ncbi:MAG: YdiU family protein [Planctomycetes bacterium]|nr:YdiU family protein [Planctomycetota bacterium]
MLVFDNRFVRELPGEDARNDTPHSAGTDPKVPFPPDTTASELSPIESRQVFGACYSWATPKPPSQPKLLAYSKEVAERLGMDDAFIHSDAFRLAFSGHTLLPGMQPFAMCYGGHQFGHWAGQLGDGRAINLGEIVNAHGERWMLQLKGSGPTPYSRRADGFAVLRSSLREFLCSEAMHHLGVPTTRALSLIQTGDWVVRDMFYDGRPRLEPGAIICRVAPTFVRFGNFEIFAARKDIANLRKIVDYVIRVDYPNLIENTPNRAAPKTELNAEIYAAWFEEICRRTATMIVHWMRVGFVHGVMNTDNMSILGLTIDYGPYGWLEDYDPSWTPNTTDFEGRRYCYGQQPQIAYWNLAQLANAIAPLFTESEPLQVGLHAYMNQLQSDWNQCMANKLGLAAFKPGDQSVAGDESLCEAFFDLLKAAEIDMTLFYRLLADYPLEAVGNQSTEERVATVREHFAPAMYRDADQGPAWSVQCARWLVSYAERIVTEKISDSLRRDRMNRVNPKVVLRNYLAQIAIDAAEAGDNSELLALHDALRRPYDDQPGKERFAEKRPEWARQRPGCSMLSCSS